MVGNNTHINSIHGKYTRRNVELPPPCFGGHFIHMINYAEEIKQAVSMPDLCEFYGLDVNRQGFARCCFHNEKTASLRIYPDGYKCYGCGQAGSVIDFVMKYFGLSFLDACAKINSDFNLGLPIGKKLSLRQQRNAERAAKERKDKREAERAHYQSLKDDWFKWLKCWDTLDGYIRDLPPKSPDDEINPLYSLAVKNIAYVNYMLDEAEMRLLEHEFNRSDHCGTFAVVTTEPRADVLPSGN